jgi:hypothetical protein
MMRIRFGRRGARCSWEKYLNEGNSKDEGDGWDENGEFMKLLRVGNSRGRVDLKRGRVEAPARPMGDFVSALSGESVF